MGAPTASLDGPLPGLGKRTLVEGLAVQRREAATTIADDGAAEGATAPRGASAGGGAQPTLQMLFAPQPSEPPSSDGMAADHAHPADGAPHGPGVPLAPDVRGRMGAAFGADFSDVRIHEGPLAAEMGAQALAQGNHIHFRPGAYDPTSKSGLELLGHELTHVVQQRQGRVPGPKDGSQANGPLINGDPALEREADDLGARAARGERVGNGVPASRASDGGVIQGFNLRAALALRRSKATGQRNEREALRQHRQRESELAQQLKAEFHQLLTGAAIEDREFRERVLAFKQLLLSSVATGECLDRKDELRARLDLLLAEKRRLDARQRSERSWRGLSRDMPVEEVLWPSLRPLSLIARAEAEHEASEDLRHRLHEIDQMLHGNGVNNVDLNQRMKAFRAELEVCVANETCAQQHPVLDERLAALWQRATELTRLRALARELREALGMLQAMEAAHEPALKAELSEFELKLESTIADESCLRAEVENELKSELEQLKLRAGQVAARLHEADKWLQSQNVNPDDVRLEDRLRTMKLHQDHRALTQENEGTENKQDKDKEDKEDKEDKKDDENGGKPTGGSKNKNKSKRKKRNRKLRSEENDQTAKLDESKQALVSHLAEVRQHVEDDTPLERLPWNKVRDRLYNSDPQGLPDGYHMKLVGTYTSKYDGSQGGFGCEYVLNKPNVEWVLHVHRGPSGGLKTGSVKAVSDRMKSGVMTKRSDYAAAVLVACFKISQNDPTRRD